MNHTIANNIEKSIVESVESLTKTVHQLIEENQTLLSDLSAARNKPISKEIESLTTKVVVEALTQLALRRHQTVKELEAEVATKAEKILAQANELNRLHAVLQGYHSTYSGHCIIIPMEQILDMSRVLGGPCTIVFKQSPFIEHQAKQCVQIAPLI